MLTWEHTLWPPPQTHPDGARLIRYQRFLELFEGDHYEALANLSAFVIASVAPERRHSREYLVANYPGLVSKLSADLLFSERPTFLADDAAAQRNLDSIVDENDLQTTLYESALSASFRGDAVFRVRRGPRASDGVEDALIDEIPADCYFVEMDPDNTRRILSECIAWVHRADDRTQFLRVEEHVPGYIRQYAYRLDEQEGKVREEVSLSEVYGDEAPPEEEETGIPRSLLVHIPNFRHGSRFWGISDYHDIWTLVDAINNRLSKIDAILDKHADPKLLLPAGSTEVGGIVRVTQSDLYEVETPAEAQIIRYVTWDGQLEAAFRQLEDLREEIFRMAEVSPAAFGLDKAGSIESGRAMRMRFIRTQAKIARKRQYFEIGIRWVLWLAQEMRRQIDSSAPATVEPVIAWRDGIPDDDIEIAEVEEKRVINGLSSRRSAMMRMFHMTAQQAEAEQQQIRQEELAPTVAPPAGVNGREAPPTGETTPTPAVAG